MDERIQKMWHTHTVGLSLSGKWMEVENAMLSDMSQAHSQGPRVSLIRGSWGEIRS